MFQFFTVLKGIKLLSYISTQLTQVGKNENPLNRQTLEGIPGFVNPRNHTFGVDGRTVFCHLGTTRTLRIVERFYWWMGMNICTR